jgi:peroxiredoxin
MTNCLLMFNKISGGHIRAILIIMVLILANSPLGYSQVAESLKVGDKAPNFSLPYATKDSISSDDIALVNLLGKKNIILAFYPADWSGGCTKEVCTLRDNFLALSELNAEVFGISGDYLFSHHEWAKYHNLSFKLLSDHNHKIAQIYQSYNPGSGYNKRTIYVIDKHGKIAYIDFIYQDRPPGI